MERKNLSLEERKKSCIVYTRVWKRETGEIVSTVYYLQRLKGSRFTKATMEYYKPYFDEENPSPRRKYIRLIDEAGDYLT